MKLILGLACLMLGLAALPVHAQPDRFALQTNLDHVWTMTAAGLVFLMQAGFLLLEAGHVRSKNSVNVAQKNLIDFIVSTVVFGAVGFTLMFGSSISGWIGWDSDALFYGATDKWHMTFFVFQLMFCGTAATIVSGAVAERMSMMGYITCTAMVGLIIYPTVGHWVWGGILSGDETPFLAAWGLIDFAGGAVVHMTGAAVALAAVLIVGPRSDKFDENGKPRVLHGHSPVLSTMGALLIWVGWIGFNGGSTTAGTEAFAHVVMNTMIAGACGGLAVTVIGRIRTGHFRPEQAINGLIGGLVAVTAGADAVTAQNAMLIGVGGGAVVFLCAEMLERAFKIDDPLQAISVHGAAGFFGLIMTGILAREDALLTADRLTQVAVQFGGGIVVFVWAFTVAYALLRVAAHILPAGPDGNRRFRVTAEAEREGLNSHEHDAPMGSGILTAAMAKVARNDGADIEPIMLEHGDDAYEMSVLFNRIIEKIQQRRQEEAAAAKAELARHAAMQRDVGEIIDACAAGHFDRRLEVENREGFELEMAERLNRLCDVTAESLTSVERAMTALANGDLSVRVNDDRGGLMGRIAETVNATLGELTATVTDLQHAVGAASNGDFSARLSTEGRQGFFLELCEGVNSVSMSCERGLDDLGRVLSVLANGDLTAEMEDSHKGRFAALAADVRRATRTLSDVISGLSQVADHVAESSEKTLHSSGRIHARSAEQASLMNSAVEALTLIDKMASDGAETSQRTAEHCAGAQSAARKGDKLATEAAQQMLEMDRAAREIAASVEQIGEIAFRTNLLAVNASVEASRQAGQTGFRVVAEEVRGLANQTAEVVGEIQERAEMMSKAFATGRERVDLVRASLGAILDAVTDASELSGTLSEMGGAQAERVSEIGGAVREIESGAKEGLDLAAEADKTARALSTDAGQSRKLISTFRLPDPAKRFAA